MWCSQRDCLSVFMFIPPDAHTQETASKASEVPRVPSNDNNHAARREALQPSDSMMTWRSTRLEACGLQDGPSGRSKAEGERSQARYG